MATTLMNDFTTTTQRIHILPSIFTVQDGHTIFDLLIYQIPETGKPCIADHYSKLRDTDDWSIDHQTFQDIDDRFGKFTIDRFADNVNTK